MLSLLVYSATSRRKSSPTSDRTKKGPRSRRRLGPAARPHSSAAARRPHRKGKTWRAEDPTTSSHAARPSAAARRPHGKGTRWRAGDPTTSTHATRARSHALRHAVRRRRRSMMTSAGRPLATVRRRLAATEDPQNTETARMTPRTTTRAGVGIARCARRREHMRSTSSWFF